MSLDRIAIGTVQFGLDYGVGNSDGQVTPSEVKTILDLAAHNRIKTLDTAILYGESESHLGDYGVSSWDVITKIPAIPSNVKDIKEWVVEQVQASLKRLNLSKVYGVMLHDADQILGRNGKTILDSLHFLKSNNLCSKVGLSIYNVARIKEYTTNNDIDLIQAPLNIFDRRLVDPDILKWLKIRHVEVHARSIFLQGLLLLDRNLLPGTFSHSDDLFNEWYGWLDQACIEPVDACLKFALQFEEVDKVVVGVQDISQLKKIIMLADNSGHIKFPEWKANINSQLIDPSLWHLKN